MPTHQWRAVEPDGQRLEFQCRYFSGRWLFFWRPKRREDWIPLEDLRRRHWDAFREQLFNKYQRQRVPWEHVVELDSLLETLPSSPDAPAAHALAKSHESEAQLRKNKRKRKRPETDPSIQENSLDPNASTNSPELELTLAQQDQRYLWHPFTAQATWEDPSNPPLVIERAAGSYLWDEAGNRYFDGNASIWTNLHGHCHPDIAQAIADQAQTLDHTSFLGTTHPTAIQLAKQLLSWANGEGSAPISPPIPHWDADAPPEPERSLQDHAPFERVFYSDNGSTALEVALRLSIQVRQAIGQPERTGFLAFENAYHGDTLGAASVSGISRFFEHLDEHRFPCTRIERIGQLENLPPEITEQLTAVVIEPGIQGVNQMRPWPKGTLTQLRDWCDEHGLLLIFDEVLTGFGRSGSLFAFQHEGVRPDFLCLAKGLSGGTLPLAATLTTAEVYQALLAPEDTFYYGHSYTANPIACAAALASMEIFAQEGYFLRLRRKIDLLAALFTALRARCPQVHEVRQYGIIAGIELRQEDGKPFAEEDKIGAKVCQAAREHGLLTRPIHDTIVFLPPLSASEEELREALQALQLAIHQVLS